MRALSAVHATASASNLHASLPLSGLSRSAAGIPLHAHASPLAPQRTALGASGEFVGTRKRLGMHLGDSVTASGVGGLNAEAISLAAVMGNRREGVLLVPVQVR